jgi:hypothetical protein
VALPIDEVLRVSDPRADLRPKNAPRIPPSTETPACITAEGQLAKQKAESNSAVMQAGVSVLGGILGAFFGRKSALGSLTRSTSSIGKATAAYKQHEDVANADAKVEGIITEITAAKAELEAAIAKITESFNPASLPLESESIKPTKSDVKVQTVALLWLPCDARGENVW